MKKVDQLEFPIVELTNVSKYNSAEGEVYALSRAVDGSLTKDFICAIPKDFPKEGIYTRERMYVANDGSKFVKKYILRGDFRESDEDERIFLTAYWRLVGNGKLEFSFFLTDYLKFKGVDHTQGKNQQKFLDYIDRTRRNTWQLNYWFDYHTKKFRQDTQYGIIQYFSVSKLKSGRGLDKIVITIGWSQPYFNALEKIENWKYFSLDVYSQVPHTNGVLKKLLYFLGNGNNEFALESGTHLIIKVELKTLCEFFLAMPERSYWEHKKSLKNPLERLKELGLIQFNNLDDCFVKEHKKNYLVLSYFPPTINKKPVSETLVLSDNSLIVQQLIQCKVSQKKAEALVLEFSEEAIQTAISILNNYNQPIKNPTRFIEKALQEGWQESSMNQEIKTDEKANESLSRDELKYLQLTDTDKWEFIKKRYLLGRAYYGLLSRQSKQKIERKIKSILPETGFKDLEEFTKKLCLGLIETLN
ncbi:MAG: hypothetical protein HQM12_17880 [SAR324 cluster bacterium]|nr:hypothetical protein [SAR324 cluster bacterium]